MTSKPSIEISRRQVLGTGLAGLAAAPALASSSDPGDDPSRVLRVAFLTDAHVQPERQGEQGFAACLAHVCRMSSLPHVWRVSGRMSTALSNQPVPPRGSAKEARAWGM